MENRIERVVVETNRYRIIGDLTLPKEGYRSRLSDYLNRNDLSFVPLADAELTSFDGGSVATRRFVAVAREHIELAYPAADRAEDPPG